MQKISSRLKYIIIAVIVLTAGAGTYLFIQAQSKPATVTAPGSTPTKPPVDLTTWTDQAGFSFQYPKNLTVDQNEEDNENYAHVELTNKDHPGNLIVWVKDPPKKWPPAGATTIDSTLGSEPAKKMISDTTLSVGCLCEDLLFLVEATTTDKEYWTDVFDTVSGSFAFTPLEPVSGSGGGGGDVDEEEVL